jgi:hypothetical protein
MAMTLVAAVHAEKRKAYLIEKSSNRGYFGVEGRTGQSCADAELMFRTTNAGAWTQSLIALRHGGRDVRLFPEGLAMLSPTCRAFWRTTPSGGVAVHDTRTGRMLGETEGMHPAWAPDGSALYVIRMDGKGGASVVKWSFSSGKEWQVIHAKDFASGVPWNGNAWWAPKIANNELRWQYPTSAFITKKAPKPGMIPAKTVVFNLSTKKAKKPEEGWIAMPH